MTSEIPSIDIVRLFSELEITEVQREQLASLHIPTDVRVTSTSVIKIGTVENTLHIAQPSRAFRVIGIQSPSDVGEQPFGQITIDGALNRLRNGMRLREETAPGENAIWVSIENGLFRVPQPGTVPLTQVRGGEDILFFTEDADLATEFDPNATYEDRAVAAIRIPGFPTIVQISPGSEAVQFPKEALLAARDAPGGFSHHTAGSKLAELGIVANKQNPHLELTANRPGGPLPRQDQMARVILRALLRLAQ